jgi:hypothetical protein
VKCYLLRLLTVYLLLFNQVYAQYKSLVLRAFERDESNLRIRVSLLQPPPPLIVWGVRTSSLCPRWCLLRFTVERGSVVFTSFHLRWS